MILILVRSVIMLLMTIIVNIYAGGLLTSLHELYCSGFPLYVLQSQIRTNVFSSKRFYWSHNDQIQNILWHHWTQCFIFLIFVQIPPKPVKTKGMSWQQWHKDIFLSISNWCNKCVCSPWRNVWLFKRHFLPQTLFQHTHLNVKRKIKAPEKQQGVLADYNLTVVVYWYHSS